MITPDNVLIGIEILYAVGGLASCVFIALWRLFSKYSKLENDIAYLKREAERDDNKYTELMRKIDVLSEEVTKMRLEMIAAHGEISERVIRVEANSTKS